MLLFTIIYVVVWAPKVFDESLVSAGSTMISRADAINGRSKPSGVLDSYPPSYIPSG
jgi:hypothetical protein